MIAASEIILYVKDQQRSRDFYAAVLDLTPTLDVPGMTEFELGDTTLGLMPERGIQRLLGDAMSISASGSRCELYLTVDDPAACGQRALAAGARELSPLLPRDWGDDVAYYADLDEHVIAFARRTQKP